MHGVLIMVHGPCRPGPGVCASPNGVALPVGPTIPVPTAYLPLTNDSTHSWPIPQYWAYNASAVKTKQTRFVRDEYFGTVIQCNASAGRLSLQNPRKLRKP